MGANDCHIDGNLQAMPLLSRLFFIRILKVEQVERGKCGGKRRTKEVSVYRNISDRDLSEQSTRMLFSDYSTRRRFF